MSDNDLLDELLGGGGKTFFGRDDKVGRSITGTITAVSVRQSRSFETGKAEVWEDGKPKLQTVITLDTTERDPEDADDDGSRNVYVKMWGDQRRALAQAAKRAGGSPKAGDTFTATFTGTTPPAVKGLNPTKVYEFTIVKANPVDAALAATEPAAQPAQAPAAQQRPAPAAASAATSGPDLAKVPALRAAGVPDEQIAAALGATLAQVQAA